MTEFEAAALVTTYLMAMLLGAIIIELFTPTVGRKGKRK